MKTWESWLHSDGADHFAMIRNHKTSRAVCKFTHKAHAEQQVRKLNKYPWVRLAELYKVAISLDLLVMTHSELSFEQNIVLRPIEIVKGEACYGLIVWSNGKRLLYHKSKKRKDVEQYLKDLRAEHSDAEIIANAQRVYEQKLNQN